MTQTVSHESPDTRPTILLCHPHVDADWRAKKDMDYSAFINWPVSLICLRSYLQAQGIRVLWLDLMCEPADYEPRLRQILSETPCVLAGISVMTAQLSSALELAKSIRDIAPELPIVWGGVHPSIFPEATLDDPLCDIVVFGEGEKTMTELVQTLVAEGGLSRAISGAGFKNDGGQVLGPRRPLLDMESLPRLDYGVPGKERYQVNHFEPYLRPYFPDGPREDRQVVFSSGRGCPYNCSFCYNSSIKQTPRYRSQSVERILDDVAYQVEHHGFNFFSWGDEHFFNSIPRAKKLLEGYIDRNIPARWFANIRADVFKKPTFREQVAPLLVQAGCARLHIGAESGSENMLAILNKQIAPTDILEGCRVFADSPVILCASFMCGVPGETGQDLMDTMTLWDRMFGIKKNLWIMGPFIFRPYAGTRLYDTALSLGYPEPKTLRDWAMVPYGMRGDIRDRTMLCWNTEEHWQRIDYTLLVKDLYFGGGTWKPFSSGRRQGLELVRKRLRSGSFEGIREEAEELRRLSSIQDEERA